MANPTFTSRTQLKEENQKTWMKNFRVNNPSEASDFFAVREQFILEPSHLNALISTGGKADLVNIIDVRKVEDFKEGHLPGAMNLPEDQWQAVDLKRNKVNVIYCYSLECPLAWKAAKIWSEQGYSVMVLLGGFEGWKEEDFKIETKIHH